MALAVLHSRRSGQGARDAPADSGGGRPAGLPAFAALDEARGVLALTLACALALVQLG